MKKLLSVLLCVAMIAGLTACGKDSKKDEPAKDEVKVEALENEADDVAEAAEEVEETEEEPEVAAEPETNRPADAVKMVSTGSKIYLVTADGEYLWLGDNGWHVSLSADNKSALRIDMAGNNFYVLTSEEWAMRLDVYEGKVSEMGATVAMYPNDGDFADNEQFTPVYDAEDEYAFRLQTTGGLYLHCSSAEKDASLSDEAGATVFYMIAE